jgi:hypothetical protein
MAFPDNYIQKDRSNDMCVGESIVLAPFNDDTFSEDNLASGMRFIYLDELQNNEQLRNSAESIIKQFNDASRGFSQGTQYGLVNGWISEE